MMYASYMTKFSSFQPAKVWLAPMSGATDAPFRRQAVRFGAKAVVSEMVAGEQLIQARPDVVRRMCRHEGGTDWIVQLAARRPSDMMHGAKLLADAGVDVVDINMGCPSKQVTGGQSGSALMRDLDLAKAIIEAALEGAAGLPVTLKMRLGWDDTSLNAPELCEIAERLGVRMLTVHGRTRCQFYKGNANWDQIRASVEAVNLPVIANGDICNLATAELALKRSGAYGVMIGRATIGKPWMAGLISGALTSEPSIEEQYESLCEQIDDSVALYGERLGVRTVRKHISAAIDQVPLDLAPKLRRQKRADLCQIDEASQLKSELSELYIKLQMGVAA